MWPEGQPRGPGVQVSPIGHALAHTVCLPAARSKARGNLPQPSRALQTQVPEGQCATQSGPKTAALDRVLRLSTLSAALTLQSTLRRILAAGLCSPKERAGLERVGVGVGVWTQDVRIMFVAAGPAAVHCLAGDANGNLYAWGRNEVRHTHAHTHTQRYTAFCTVKYRSLRHTLPCATRPMRSTCVCVSRSTSVCVCVCVVVTAEGSVGPRRQHQQKQPYNCRGTARKTRHRRYGASHTHRQTRTHTHWMVATPRSERKLGSGLYAFEHVCVCVCMCVCVCHSCWWEASHTGLHQGGRLVLIRTQPTGTHTFKHRDTHRHTHTHTHITHISHTHDHTHTLGARACIQREHRCEKID